MTGALVNVTGSELFEQQLLKLDAEGGVGPIHPMVVDAEGGVGHIHSMAVDAEGGVGPIHPMAVDAEGGVGSSYSILWHWMQREMCLDYMASYGSGRRERCGEVIWPLWQ